jgi:UDP-glucose 4-epimerase
MKYQGDYYAGKSVLVTGGASFIGSTLVERLVAEGANVSVVDDFSTGKLENLETVSNRIEIFNQDLSLTKPTFEVLNRTQPKVVFHLAAIHGGRGFIETYQRRILQNSIIDSNVFDASVSVGADMIVHASSACVYPIQLQESEKSRGLLKESDANFETPGGAFPDGTYGWMKLMGEYFLETMVQGTTTLGRSARIFTAYGERENESHAAVALVAKALLKMDPFEVWGSGSQTRNFTYVSDTVTGLMLLGQDTRERRGGVAFDVVNVGNSTHWTVNNFVEQALINSGFTPAAVVFNSDKPTGVASRALDNTKIQELFEWEPEVGLEIGVQRLTSWYSNWSGRAQTIAELRDRLI